MRTRRRRSARRPLGLLVALALVLAGVAAAYRALQPAPPGGDRPAPDAIDRVVRVVDGDTVVLRATGTSRLIGVDTPEVFGGRECFGREASAFAERLLPRGARVGVELDVEERDRYGRTLIYLRLADRRSLNELLVAEGFAVPLTIPPNVRNAERFTALARQAREREAGLWSPRACGGDADRPVG